MDIYHSIDSDPPPLPISQQSLHEELEQLTQQFLAQGGVIFDATVCTQPHKSAAFNGCSRNKRSQSHE